MVLLTDAVMGRRRDTNQRGVLYFSIELRGKRFEEKEEEEELKSRGKKKKGPN